MNPTKELVSICLPVRNGADRIEEVVWSVLAQDHERIELVISDNASTDGTEEVCRELARSDPRIVYHRHAVNVGLLNNFVGAMRLSKGTFFRWVGDDDWLAPDCVSRGLAAFAEDERRILVTTTVAYTGPDGITRTDDRYDGVRLASADPIVRFTEILRLLNESALLVDPLYGLVRRDPVAAIPRRNMLKEDEVFATKLALAGPWGHVPEVLAHRNTRTERMADIARRLGVPSWQSHLASTLQVREILRWLPHAGLTPDQLRQARTAVAKMYLRRQRRTYAHRSRKLARLAAGLVR
ncbi:MAG TPA: glycosyltransferase family 2 protein [Actinophytocola sp.]|uniref:glycosyltransferase family 2 protein n=1 Tax=Actinophytocola sp. TaxID=1872138 RepID=UPI002DDD6B7A|nr:glycosyltransferase family 2 protein [Actinophytocola sp.]HEV2779870.1 glycosyltransferase family 2 protein [Actinophytocola sp.]